MGCCDDHDTPQLIELATLLQSTADVEEMTDHDVEEREREDKREEKSNNNSSRRVIVKIAAGNLASTIVLRNISL